MTDRVNGNVRGGEFLTGNMDWFSIATLVPLWQTNVDTPVVDLPGYQTWATLGTWTDVTVVDGEGIAQTYTNLNDYLDAFYKQANLNLLINTFAGRANPVAVSVKLLPSSINGNAINPYDSEYFADANYTNYSGGHVFGSGYDNTGYDVYIVNLASEKVNLWTDGGNGTNVGGYSLLSDNTPDGGLNGASCFDLPGGTVLNGSSDSSPEAVNSPYAKTNTEAPYVNTFLTNGTNTNTLVAQSSNLAGTSLV